MPKGIGFELKMKNIFTLLCLMSAGFTYANTVKNEDDTKPLGPEQLEGISQCSNTVADYVDWRSKALNVGHILDEIEFGWLGSAEYYLNGPDIFMYADSKDKSAIYKRIIVPEQKVKSILGISVYCKKTNGAKKYEGVLAARVELVDGSKVTLYYHFLDFLFRLFGSEYFADPATIFKKYESVSEDFISSIEAQTEKSRSELIRLKGISPDKLVFTEEEVELRFAWPTNTLVKTDERMEVKRSDNGETTDFFIVKHHYESAITATDEGVRVSALANNISYQYKEKPDGHWNEPDRQYAIDCIADKDIRDCWSWVPGRVGTHYQYNNNGQFSDLPVDDLFTSEVQKWMDEQLTGLDKADMFKQKMLAHLAERTAEKKGLLTDYHRYFNYHDSHGKIVTKGEINEYVAVFRFPGIWRYPRPRHRFIEPGLESKYMGRVSCNEQDSNRSCIEFQYVPRPLELDDNVSAQSVFYNETNVRIIMDPHTLLTYELHYEFNGEEKSKGSPQVSLMSDQIKIDIQYSYELLMK